MPKASRQSEHHDICISSSTGKHVGLPGVALKASLDGTPDSKMRSASKGPCMGQLADQPTPRPSPNFVALTVAPPPNQIEERKSWVLAILFSFLASALKDP